MAMPTTATVPQAALRQSVHPHTALWLSDERTLRFLGSVDSNHHPWLQAFANASTDLVAFLPASDSTEYERLSVGFDIDEVLYPWTQAFRAYVVQHEGFPADQCQPRRSYSFVDHWPFESEEHFVQVMRRGEDAGLNFSAAPIDGAVRVTNRARGAGHDVHLVTARAARGGRTRAETLDWLDDHEISYTSLTISRDKTAVATDVFFDDRDSNCDDLAQAGTLAVLIDDSHNENVDRHLRVDSLHIASDIVDSYARWAARQ